MASFSTTLPVSQPEVVIEALPAVGAAQLDAAELRQDAAADGGQAWPWRRSGLGRAAGSFSPEPQMLQEREGELAQEPVVVQATPAPALEMVEAQLVLHLLVHLLADPTSLDQGRQDLERRIGRVIGQVVLPLAAGAMLADQPSLFTRKMLPFGGYRPVGHPYPDGGERGLKRAFGAGSPRDDTERGRPVLDQLSGSHARQRGHRMLY